MPLRGQHSVGCCWSLSFSRKLFRTILLKKMRYEYTSICRSLMRRETQNGFDEILLLQPGQEQVPRVQDGTFRPLLGNSEN